MEAAADLGEVHVDDVGHPGPDCPAHAMPRPWQLCRAQSTGPRVHFLYCSYTSALEGCLSLDPTNGSRNSSLLRPLQLISNKHRAPETLSLQDFPTVVLLSNGGCRERHTRMLVLPARKSRSAPSLSDWLLPRPRRQP